MAKIYECDKGHLQYEIELNGFGTYATGELRGLCHVCNSWCTIVADTDDGGRLRRHVKEQVETFNKIMELEERISKYERIAGLKLRGGV